MRIRSIHILLPRIYRSYKVVDIRPSSIAVDVKYVFIFGCEFRFYLTRKGHDGKGEKTPFLRWMEKR